MFYPCLNYAQEKFLLTMKKSIMTVSILENKPTLGEIGSVSVSFESVID